MALGEQIFFRKYSLDWLIYWEVVDEEEMWHNTSNGSPLAELTHTIRWNSR